MVCFCSFSPFPFTSYSFCPASQVLSRNFLPNSPSPFFSPLTELFPSFLPSSLPSIIILSFLSLFQHYSPQFNSYLLTKVTEALLQSRLLLFLLFSWLYFYLFLFQQMYFFFTNMYCIFSSRLSCIK